MPPAWEAAGAQPNRLALSGTWWVGTGDKFDPDNTAPMPAVTYVTHYAGKIHYDDAKDGETIIEMHGMGPATSAPVPQAR